MFQQGLEGFGTECLLMAGKVVEAIKVKNQGIYGPVGK